MTSMPYGSTQSGLLERLPRRMRCGVHRAMVLTGVALLSLSLACGGKHGQTGPAPAPASAPVIASFTAPGYNLGGQSSALNWDVTGATHLSIDQGVGAVSGTSCWVHPHATTTYTLTATNPSGNTTATCTMTVYAAEAGVTTLLANIPNFPCVDGPALDAKFNYTSGVALDSAGNLYVADYGNQAIRMLSPQGVVSTLISALPAGPWALAVGTSGTVYFTQGSAICRLSLNGHLSTLAGSPDQTGNQDGAGTSALFSSPRGLAVDAAENVYVTDTGNHTIRVITPQGGVTTLAGAAGSPGKVDGAGASAQFNRPLGIAMGPEGNLYVVDSSNAAIRIVTPLGQVTTLSGPLPSGSPAAVGVDAAGTVYVGGSGSILKITAKGTTSTLAGTERNYGLVNGPGAQAKFYEISGLVVDAAGNLFAADYQNSLIRRVTPSGLVSTVAGQQAKPSFGPVNVGVGSGGEVFMPASDNTILKVSPTGAVSPFAGVSKLAGSLDGPAAQSLFGSISGTAVDPAGNVYVTDLANGTLRKITPGGQVTTVAGAAGQFGGQDGLGAQARFNGPTGVVVDDQGNAYVTDGGTTVRKITPEGNVTTLAGAAGQIGFTDGSGSAARFNHAYGIAVDASGNLFVADCFNAAIRKVTPAGVVSTLAFTFGCVGSAGAAGKGPLLYSPTGVAVDGSGNVYVSDSAWESIWQISPAGIASQVPRFNASDTLNFHATGLAFRGGRLHMASPWGVALVRLY